MECDRHNMWFEGFIKFTRNIYGSEYIPLHRPVFNGNEKQYLIECIDSNYVSSVGEKVIEFENKVKDFVGSKFAIATVNGTAALHVALQLAGVSDNDEVITQALTFIGTCNPIKYVGAHPIFVDVDMDTLGLSPVSLKKFLLENAIIREGRAWNKKTGRRIAACVPMHTFGLPCRVDMIESICTEWGIELIEDSAESLGSFTDDKHTGTKGLFGIFSFNGNKIITTGGGGMIITDNEHLAQQAKHRTTTSKITHVYEFIHDEIGYNYRMPNINAALGCAQMESITVFLDMKQKIHELYSDFFCQIERKIIKSLNNCKTNYWLNAVILNGRQERDDFLRFTNQRGVMTRPIWRLMSELEMFKHCQHDGLENSVWLQDRVVNIPSSALDIT